MSERRPIRLLVVAPPTGGGGMERAMVVLIEGLDRSQVVPSLALTHSRAFNRQLMESLPAGVHVIELMKGNFVDQLRVARALARHIDEARPDVVLGQATYASVLALAARRLAHFKTRVIATEHSTPELLRERPNLWLRWLARRLYPGADLVVTVSQGMANAITHAFGLRESQVRVVDNAFHPTIDARLAESTPLDPPLPAPGPVIVYIGRLSPEKGVADLIDAVALLRRDEPARLMVIGEGPLRAELEQRARRLGLAEAVTFAGYIKHPYRYMAAADVLVMPSLSEAAGTAIIEGMRAGAAIVSTTCDFGPRELIDNERTGLLVAPGAPQELAAAMLRLIRDPGLATRLGSAARAASERFEPTGVMARYTELILAVAEHRQP